MSVETVESVLDGAVQGIEPSELDEWYESLEDVLYRYGPEKTRQLLVHLRERAYLRGVMMPAEITTPYINTIHVTDQSRYPGNLEIDGASRASSAGTRWRWSCGPINRTTARASAQRIVNVSLRTIRT